MTKVERFLEKLEVRERRKKIFSYVNAIEYFPDSKVVHIYIKGKREIIPDVLKVKWIPFIEPESPYEKLPVTSFKTDTLSTYIHFNPMVKVEYDPVAMELTIIHPE